MPSCRERREFRLHATFLHRRAARKRRRAQGLKYEAQQERKEADRLMQKANCV